MAMKPTRGGKGPRGSKGPGGGTRPRTDGPVAGKSAGGGKGPPAGKSAAGGKGPRAGKPPGDDKPRRTRRSSASGAATENVSLERALSKLGYASRTQARALIEGGHVRVNGKEARDPSLRLDVRRARIEVDGQAVRPERRIYLALHKPRGLVTSEKDEQGRETVFSCLAGADLPRLVPVGRLDMDSEGLLLFTNDTRWAQRVLDPASHVDKIYEVHVAGAVDDALLRSLRAGVESRGELLRLESVRRVRGSEESSVLEIVLREGRNRHIRRMLEGLQREVELLRRVAIGPVSLGRLGPGAHRMLSEAEVAALGGTTPVKKGP